MAKRKPNPSKVHGSVYPGPTKYQDSKYAAKVEESQKKARQAAKSE